MAKGMIISILFFFLSALLLTLGIYVLTTAHQTELRTQEIGTLMRTADLDASIQKAIRDTFTSSSGMTFIVNATTFTIIEPFPNTNLINNSLNALKQHVQTTEPSIVFNLANITRLRLTPYDYFYTKAFENATLLNLTPTSTNYNSYTFTFTTSNYPVGTITFLDSDAGSFNILIVSKNSTTETRSNRSVNILTPLEAEIAGINGGKIEIDIVNQSVGIKNTLNLTILSNISITFFNTTAQQPHVELSPIYTIFFQEFNLTKTPYITLTT
ncbi:MAG: hypothetical protein WC595_00215 [Candidatus Nanoarchaeia archaeon]